MGNHHLSEFAKVMYGGSRAFRRAIHMAKCICASVILPQSDKEWDALTPRQQARMRVVQHRLHALHLYWEYQSSMGKTKKQAAQKVGRSRDTLREWEKRYQKYGQRGLIPKSRARKKPPPRTARTLKAFDFVAAHRLLHTDGKEVLCEVMRRAGFDISASSVGRLIKEVGRSRRFARRMKSCRLAPKRSQKRTHAKRLREKPQVSAPGYVQMDHKQAFIAGTKLIVFAVRDVHTRAIYMMAASNATAAAAARALAHAQQCAGYAFTDVQTDNGSEFRAQFEEKLAAHGIRHHLIPVRSPKWNSLVENFFSYLSRSVLNVNGGIIASVPGLQEAMDETARRYNDKPNTALAYTCPKTGRRRLRTPNEILYTSTLSLGKITPPTVPKMY